LGLSSEEPGFFWPVSLECWAFFSNFVDRFWPFSLSFGLKYCNPAIKRRHLGKYCKKTVTADNRNPCSFVLREKKH